MAGSPNSDTDSSTKASTTKADGRSIKYVGNADVRKISKSDWASVGVEDQEQVVWDASNNFTVAAADLKPAALDYFQKDAGFKVVEPQA